MSEFRCPAGLEFTKIPVSRDGGVYGRCHKDEDGFWELCQCRAPDIAAEEAAYVAKAKRVAAALPRPEPERCGAGRANQGCTDPDGTRWHWHEDDASRCPGAECGKEGAAHTPPHTNCTCPLCTPDLWAVGIKGGRLVPIKVEAQVVHGGTITTEPSIGGTVSLDGDTKALCPCCDREMGFERWKAVMEIWAQRGQPDLEALSKLPGARVMWGTPDGATDIGVLILRHKIAGYSRRFVALEWPEKGAKG